MSGASKKLMGTTAAGGGPLAIEDVFSTYLYAPATNNSQVSVVNGIDLTGNDGMVWIKRRDGEALYHALVDTLRGGNKVLHPNLDAGQYTASIVSNFSSDGFTTGTSSFVSTAPENFASWTFRKAPRFFDVVTYTGNGVGPLTVSHNLGVSPGCIVIKRTDSTGDWFAFHRSLSGGFVSNHLKLNTTNASLASSGGMVVSDADFQTYAFAGANDAVNESGATYVAYLFAHDPLGPSEDGSDGLIACGSYTGNGSTDGPEIDLGWEPQWVMTKRLGSTGNWIIQDSMRSLSLTNTDMLFPNLSNAATTGAYGSIAPNATGFKIVDNGTNYNASGGTYIYIAIRRGPMRAPTSGTEVFAPAVQGQTPTNPTWVSNFVTDWVFTSQLGISDKRAMSRLQGFNYMETNSTGSEASDTNHRWDFMNGFGIEDNQTDKYAWMFRRAPGFFDVVAYTGDDVAGRTVPHNLGVAPEMMWVKRRDPTGGWITYNSASGPTKYQILNGTQSDTTFTGAWNDTAPTSSVFAVGSGVGTNQSGATYIAHLFATLAGVSKVGSYTGNGSSQTIDCGFTSGARFILIKRTDSTGDWYVWDTARGIVTGNDPFLELNTTDAEVTSDDSIDPDSSGFIVNQTATTNVNVSSASYIFYAVS